MGTKEYILGKLFIKTKVGPRDLVADRRFDVFLLDIGLHIFSLLYFLLPVRDMAAAALLNETDIITCSVCFYEFDEFDHCPKLLPCSHTFCFTCLKVNIIPNS